MRQVGQRLRPADSGGFGTVEDEAESQDRADTAERVVQPRFYSNSEARMQAALGMIRDAGCRFLVAARSMAGVFQTLSHVSLPRAFRDLFVEIPPDEFRVDVSSSSLRG